MPRETDSRKKKSLPVRMLMFKVPIRTTFEHNGVRMIKVKPKVGMTETGSLINIPDSMSVTILDLGVFVPAVAKNKDK